MILTCPDCSTRYSVDDKAIGPNGRTVRCSNCGASWFASADPDIMALQENSHTAMTPVVDNANDSFVAPPVRPTQPQPQPQPQVEAEVPREPEPAVGAHVQIRDKADQKRRNRRLVGVFMIWAVTLGLLFAAGILAVMFRQPIVDKMPSVASVYRVFGVPVTQSGLDFDPPQSRTIVVDGQRMLVVNGFIVNRSNEARPVPMIELSLMNRGGDVLVRWAVEPSQSVLAAGKRMEYESSYPSPPLDATSLQYKFLEEGESVPLSPDPKPEQTPDE